MYTYVIIDDEKLIRWGLISKVGEIESEIFECIGQASNGAEGLEVIGEVNPDIVITDMKMARMDGVEFLQKLSEIKPGIPVIVISGYKAFDYMNQAIEQGVIGYVLKPFSTKEIEKQLLKAVSRIEQQRNVAKMQEKVDTIERQTEGKEILQFITKPWQEENKIAGRDFSDQWHILVNICTNKPEFMNILWKCVNESMGESISLCLDDPADPGQYFMLCSGTQTEILNSKKNVENLLDKLKLKARGYKLFVSIGKEIYGLTDLNKLYQKNEKMMRDVFLTRNFQVFNEDTYSYTRKDIYTDDNLRDVMVALKYNKEKKDLILKKFFQGFNIEKHTLRDIGFAVKMLLSRVDDWALQNQIETDDIMGVFYKRYRCQSNLEKMEKEVSGYINLITMSVERKNGSSEYIYESMIKYIDGHYDEKITLQTLAEQFYVSAAWCSNILKLKTNKSLPVYLTEIRISRAKELLDDTDMSVDQISREVGYPNPKYFFRTFKQMTTFTPIEYRNRRK